MKFPTYIVFTAWCVFFFNNSYAESPPNIVVIISDDQRVGTISGVMPNVERYLFSQGTEFQRAYVTTPACCPSRSSIFSGNYAHKHGVHLNSDAQVKPTYVAALQRAGYFTGLVGKYLNSWDGSPRPEFDFWVSFPGGGADYFNPVLNIRGESARRPGYITDLLGHQVQRFFRAAKESQKPFFLIFTPNAPHAPAVPLPQDANLFNDIGLWRPDNYLEGDRSDKPLWLRANPFAPASRLAKLDTFRLNQLRTLHALDRELSNIFESIDEIRADRETAIFYISDNGVFWGEHGLESKDCAYEEAIHVPFAFRDAYGRGGGLKVGQLVANIDIGPTIFDVAGVRPPASMDGLSLLPLIRGNASSWREELLIEGWRHDLVREPFKAAHTGRYKYIENQISIAELYDLELDPYELDNLIDLPEYEQVKEDMRARLDRLLKRSTATPSATRTTAIRPGGSGPSWSGDDVLDNTIEEIPGAHSNAPDIEDLVPLVPEDIVSTVDELNKNEATIRSALVSGTVVTPLPTTLAASDYTESAEEVEEQEDILELTQLEVSDVQTPAPKVSATVIVTVTVMAKVTETLNVPPTPVVTITPSPTATATVTPTNTPIATSSSWFNEVRNLVQWIASTLGIFASSDDPHSL